MISNFSKEIPPHFQPTGAGAICFCEWDGRILALKRSPGASQGGLWTAAPGGKIEKGETPLQAAVRETFEETQLRVASERLNWVGRFYVQIPDMQYTLDIYYTRFESDPGPVVINPDEHTEYRWLRPEEVLELPLMLGGAECIREVFLVMTSSEESAHAPHRHHSGKEIHCSDPPASLAKTK